MEKITLLLVGETKETPSTLKPENIPERFELRTCAHNDQDGLNEAMRTAQVAVLLLDTFSASLRVYNVCEENKLPLGILTAAPQMLPFFHEEQTHFCHDPAEGLDASFFRKVEGVFESATRRIAPENVRF